LSRKKHESAVLTVSSFLGEGVISGSSDRNQTKIGDNQDVKPFEYTVQFRMRDRYKGFLKVTAHVSPIPVRGLYSGTVEKFENSASRQEIVCNQTSRSWEFN
jgi:hypothetical protein